MTRYTVVWTKGAHDELAELWVSTSDRSALTAAADAIDVQLALNPSEKGSVLSEGLRAFFAPPLRVIYAVSEEDRLVEILRVRSL